MAAALLDIEPRLRRVQGYQQLPKLRMASKRALRLEPASQREAAWWYGDRAAENFN